MLTYACWQLLVNITVVRTIKCVVQYIVMVAHKLTSLLRKKCKNFSFIQKTVDFIYYTNRVRKVSWNLPGYLQHLWIRRQRFVISVAERKSSATSGRHLKIERNVDKAQNSACMIKSCLVTTDSDPFQHATKCRILPILDNLLNFRRFHVAVRFDYASWLRHFWWALFCYLSPVGR